MGAVFRLASVVKLLIFGNQFDWFHKDWFPVEEHRFH